MTTHRINVSTNDPEVLEELIRSAEAADEPGDRQGTILEGDLPMAVDMVKSAGYVRMWVVATGEERYCSRNMIAHNLSKRGQDGKAVFTFRDPGIRPNAGSLVCYLHPSHERRGEFDGMGFPVCEKAGRFSTHFDVMQHMRARHRAEFRMMEEEEEGRRREEDRELQRATLRSISGAVQAPPAPPAAPAPTAEVAQPKKRGRRPMTEEQKQAARERLAAARAKKAARASGQP